MPHLDTATYMHNIITFWLALTILLLWNRKTHYILHKKYKIIKHI